MEEKLTPINDGTSLNQDASLHKERFLVDYSSKKGWDSKNLSTEQLLEITSNPGYKKAGLIFG